MSNIKLNLNNKESGKVVYNVGILRDIVSIAVAEVEGTAQGVQGKKNGIALSMERDGIYVDVSVFVKYGYNAPELAYRIQQSVKQSVENMTNFKVVEVNVHVLDVVFDDAPVEKEEEEHDEHEEDEEEENN